MAGSGSRMQWRRLQMGRVVCAWCRFPIASLEHPRPKRPEVSHGLCRPCATRLADRLRTS